MNYITTGRHDSFSRLSHGDTKSPPTEGSVSSYPNSRRSTGAANARQIIPNTTFRISSTTNRSSRIGTSQHSVSDKWFKEPKIPVRLNSSTLIRMKSKNPSADQKLNDSRANNQLTVAALSFLKRDRRMSDFEVAKGISPFGDTSYVKSVFLNILTPSHGRTMAQASANSFGDGMHTSATYHRISAFSLNDGKSECNLKFVEHVSYEGTGPPFLSSHVDPAVQSNTDVSASRNGSNSFSMYNLSTMLKQATLSDPKKLQNCHDDTSDVDSHSGQGVEEHSTRVMKKKKKMSRKHKRAALVTNLKNSSVKLVRKTTSKETGI